MSIALAVRVSPLFALRRPQTTEVGQLPHQGGSIVFCYLKQDLQDEQDEQDVGDLCSQLRSVRTFMSIARRTEKNPKVR